MRVYRFVGLFLIAILLATILVTPVFSATYVSKAVAPQSIVTQVGSTSGALPSLATLEQTGTEDNPSSYMTFSTPGSIYSGHSVFRLDSDVQVSRISTLLFQVNFKGPAASTQTWSWSIYNWRTQMWNKLGDTIPAAEDQWNTLTFRIRSLIPYISNTRELRIQFQSNNANGDAKLDYAALHITYLPVPPTATRGISTAIPTKGSYNFPSTHTPSPTSTSTLTPTPTNTPTTSPPITWPQVSLTTHKSGFSSPVDIMHANDGTNRIFIVERCGTIKIIENGTTLPANFLSITVNCASSERGLLSMAFPPEYAGKNYFYVVYTRGDGDLILSRFSVPGATPNQADADSEEQILRIEHSSQTNHNGGKLAFGEDGYLYWSTGDGGGAGDPDNNGQNINSLLGKILRLDVESGVEPYAIPSSNPFVGVNGDDRIWAYGLRNPWRISFDRLTHDLYIADVGQGSWEEVNVQPASSDGGENYGWRIREGDHCYNPASGCGTPANYVPPVTEYSHSLGCSVTGGYVYRGSEFSDMQGFYFYGDYCSGRIWGLKQNNGTWSSQVLLDTDLRISAFGEDEAGNLYIADLSTGTVYKIQSSAGGSTPTIAGCPLFPADHIWNARVDSLPVHARSSDWINSIGANDSLHMDFGAGTWDGGPIGIPYNILSGSTVTKYTVDFVWPDESDAGPYPIPANPNMEWGSDHHILSVDTDDCTLYELFDAEFSGGQWSAGSGAIWSLNSNALRPAGHTSADAAGLPILPGLVRYEEVATGEINHVLRFTANATNSYIWPARHLTSGTPGVLTSTPPMGARFRLKASFDISGYPAEMQVILRAMKEYGIILADNGSDWYVSGVPHESWDNDTLHLLDDLTGSDFEAVDTSSLIVNINSGQVAP